MMMRTGPAGLMVAGLIAFASGAAMLTACGSFSGDDVQVAPDGGADTSVGGEARGEVDIELTKGLVLIHGQALVLDVKVTRKPPFTKGMTLTARGLPTGLGSDAVDITPNETSAKLRLTVGKEVPQGTLANVTVEATNEGATIGMAPIDAFVQGSAGELDTTFGNAGQVDLGVDYNGLAMRSDGSFYVLQALNQSEVRRYSKDGVLDKTFGTAGVYSPGSAMSAIAWKEPYLYIAGATPIAPYKWYVRRLTADGKIALPYGTDGTYERTSAGGPNSLSGLSIGPDGEALLAGGIGLLGTLVPVTKAGVGIGQTEWTPPTALTGALWDGTRSVAIGSKGTVLSAISANQMFDTVFADNGSLSTNAKADLYSIAADGPGRYVVGGIDSDTDQLVVERVSSPFGAAASLDATFANQGYLLTGIKTYAGGGHVAVAADRKILQTATVMDGQKYRCLIARYTTDGVLDSTFGGGGQTVAPFDDCYVGQVATQPDGHIVVAGRKLLRFWP